VLRNTAHRFRLICTTSEDLELMTDEGRFHDELFYRVASLPVTIPTLQQRMADLPEIIKSILRTCTNPHFDAKLIEFDPESLQIMQEYHWPGNVLELHQVVTRIAVATESRMIGADQLPEKLKAAREWATLEDYLTETRRSYISKVLRSCQGDRTAAARVLGIDESELG
jgi:DNA-binding NtrC family response regulator